MNANAWADQLPLSSLSRRPFGQPGIPREWNRHSATVLEMHGQRLRRDLNVGGDRRFSCQT